MSELAAAAAVIVVVSRPADAAACMAAAAPRVSIPGGSSSSLGCYNVQPASILMALPVLDLVLVVILVLTWRR